MLHSLLQFSPEEMTETLKEYHFTDEQIDTILRLVRNEAINRQHDFGGYSSVNLSYNELANQIEDQIVNHPTND
jgi:hypothetical protein